MLVDPFVSFISFLNSTGFVFELMLSVALFVWKVKRRRNFALKLAFCLLTMIVIALVWSACVPSNALTAMIRCITFYLAFYITLRLCLRLDFRKSLLFLVAGVTAQHFIYCGAQILTYLTSSALRPAIPVQVAETYFYPLMLIPMFLLVYGMFAKRIQAQAFDDISISVRILLLIVGVFLCVTVFASLYNGYPSGTGQPSLVFIAFVLTRMITCGFLLELLAEMGDRFAVIHESAVLQQLLSQQKNRLAADKETIDLINIKTHDLKKQLQLLNGKISQDEIQDLNKLVTIYDSTIRTGNDALDVLLTNKSLICGQRGIRLERMIDGSRLNFMKPQDIYSLFGNALDNAIEAVSKIADKSLRYIHMTVKASKGMVIFHIDNPYQGELAYRDGDDRVVLVDRVSTNPHDGFGGRTLRTSKGDERYHGFGVQSIKLVAHQYQGVVTINAADGIFSLDVLLPGGE